MRDEQVSADSERAKKASEVAQEHYREVKKEILEKIKLQVEVRKRAILQKRESGWVKYQNNAAAAPRKSRLRM